MDVAYKLWETRRRAGLTQRQLAEKSGIAQPVIARIEKGRSIPRVDTFARLIEACGFALEVTPPIGEGIDRTQMYELRKLSPTDRLRAASAAALWLHRIDEIFRRNRAS